MSSLRKVLCVVLVLCLSGVTAGPLAAQTTPAPAAPQAAPDPWPRQVKSGTTTFLIYQPQLDSWSANQLEGHAAVSVKTAAAKDPTFGVIWFTARTEVDKVNRVVFLEDLNITRSSFPSAPASAAAWQAALQENEQGKKSKAIALDRLEADLGIVTAKKTGESRPLNNAPPAIIFSNVPAVLVLVDGAPVFKPQTGTSMQRLINTSAIVLQASTGELYFHLFDGWLTAASLQGPWKVADPHFGRKDDIEKAYNQIIAAGNGDPMTGGSPSDPKAPKPSLKTPPVPVVYMETQPTELIVVDGQPNYDPIPNTQLLYVTNTTGRVFKDIDNQNTYVLIAGRWFSAASTAGPWQYVPAASLPPDFAKIPDESPMENVKSSVPGTSQAQEAVIASSIPQTASVQRSAQIAKPITFDGAPQLKPIEGTTLQYVANASTPIIMTGAVRVLRVPERHLVFRGRDDRAVDGRGLGAAVHLHDPAHLPALQPHVRAGLQLDAERRVHRLHARLHRRDRHRRRRRLRHRLRLHALDRIGLVRAAGHLWIRRQPGLHAVDRLGIRLRRGLRLCDGRRMVRLRLGLRRLGLGRCVRRLLRRLGRRGLGPRRRRGVGTGLRALVLGQRLQPLGLDERGDAQRRRIQRVDGQRVARLGGSRLQLEDRRGLRGTARRRLQRLHRQLRGRRARRGGEHEDGRERDGRPRHGRQRLHRQLRHRRARHGHRARRQLHVRRRRSTATTTAWPRSGNNVYADHDGNIYRGDGGSGWSQFNHSSNSWGGLSNSGASQNLSNWRLGPLARRQPLRAASARAAGAATPGAAAAAAASAGAGAAGAVSTAAAGAGAAASAAAAVASAGRLSRDTIAQSRETKRRKEGESDEKSSDGPCTGSPAP